MASSKKQVLEHHETLWQELICHFPYAIFSVALSIVVLGFLTYHETNVRACHHLFHTFHFLHILFAATGAILIFRKYSQNNVLACGVGLAVPTIFCTLSDSVLPFLGGWYLNLSMHFHWCFWEHLDVVIPFLIVGVLNGFVLSTHSVSRQMFYSVGSHFSHIFISAMASILYLVSYGFAEWAHHLGFVFLFMIGAVLIPCTLSDVIVPMFFAKLLNRTLLEGAGCCAADRQGHGRSRKS